MIFLCRTEDLARTGAKGIVLGEGSDRLEIAVTEGAIYLNDARTPGVVAREKRSKRNW